MKAKEIHVGRVYIAKVSNRLTKVKVVAKVERFDHKDKSRTVYDVVNLTTGRRTTFRSAQKFRREAVKPMNPEPQIAWNEPSNIQEGGHLPSDKDFDELVEEVSSQ